MSDLIVTCVNPAAGIAGGEVILGLQRVTADMLPRLQVRFCGADAHLVSANTRRAVALVPDIATDGPLPISVATDSGEPANSDVSFTLGRRIASTVHPVTN